MLTWQHGALVRALAAPRSARMFAAVSDANRHYGLWLPYAGYWCDRLVLPRTRALLAKSFVSLILLPALVPRCWPSRTAKASRMTELHVVASCPEFCHDAVQGICQTMKFVKAFGQKGDCVDLVSDSGWVDKWKMRVVQAVTTSLQLHPQCSTVKIFCIEGGKHCNAEMAAVPDLKKAIQMEMSQMGRTVRTPLSWLSFEEFEEETSGLTYSLSSIY
eukprot:Skav202997  [mRNA]  locus=scaffold1344:51075:52554:+ [translate_table: standard]